MFLLGLDELLFNPGLGLSIYNAVSILHSNPLWVVLLAGISASAYPRAAQCRR